MTCKICDRNSCTECFHSIEEQEEFEAKTGKPIQIPDDIDPDYEAMVADLTPESPK